MENIRTRPLGPVTPAGTLTDVIDLFRAAREWSIDMDEQLRAEGVEPVGATLGMPATQLDVILVILERTHGAMQEALVALAAAERTLATARRYRRVAMRWALACGVLTLVNVVCVIVWWF